MNETDKLLGKLKDSYEAINAPQSLLAGLSGGADSVCLVSLLTELRREKGFHFSCVHVNHQLRENAPEDERYVKELCDAWQLPLIVKRVRVSSRGNLEANARDARYRAFDEALAESGADILVLGHHMDDQAETLLMRLMRGAGPTGLSAMRPYARHIWRPLLSVRRAELEDYLIRLSIGWREDESNLDSRFTRNAVRKHLVPLMEEISPDCVPNMAAISGLLGDEEEWWQEFSDKWLWENASLHPSCLYLKLENFVTLHVSARRRILRALCVKAGLTPGRSQTERLILLAQAKAGQASENLSGQIRAFKTAKRLYLVEAGNAPLPLGKLTDTQMSADGNRRVEVFDADRLEGAALRYRMPGDRITPLGMKGSQSLSDYMINRRMDRPLRDQWPVLAKGQNILWVIGHGMGQAAALTGDTNRSRALCYTGRLPDETEKEFEE